jgi:nitrite reductase/ring-hydroxylating ferredoxin subunit
VESQSPASPSRRNVVTGLAAVGVAVPLLAACSEATPSGPTAKAGAVLTKTADIPVGGGTVLKSANVVVTQPTAGTFKCFTATCTHQGCQVGGVSGGEIVCPCHGSQFSIVNGAPTAETMQAGLAQTPLASISITVKGGEISLA